MEKKIELLDCTLRDGSYINDSHFGTPVIKGSEKEMRDNMLIPLWQQK